MPGDRVAQFPLRLPRRRGCEHVPEQVVIEVSAAVVLHRGTARRGDTVELAQQFIERELLQLGMFRDGLVELLHVGGVVAAVMQLQRLLVEVRLERIVGIGQVLEHERIHLAPGARWRDELGLGD